MNIAFIIPCLNEQTTIGKVINDCQKYMPQALVYVLDNGSTDNSAKVALELGACVISSPLRGKGNVLRHAFRVIEAEYYVMIDGDGTYPVYETPRLISLAADQNFEMVMGARLQLGRREAFRPLHYFGNRLFTNLVRVLFGFPVHDLLTGFRVFSRRFVQHTQLLSSGFEVETELTLRAVAQNFAFTEVEIPYQERPPQSLSKLRTFRDGWGIAKMVVRMWKAFRPFTFYTSISLLSLVLAYSFSAFAIAFQGTAALSFVCGLVLHSLLDNQRMQSSIQKTNTTVIRRESFKKSAS